MVNYKVIPMVIDSDNGGKENSKTKVWTNKGRAVDKRNEKGQNRFMNAWEFFIAAVGSVISKVPIERQLFTTGPNLDELERRLKGQGLLSGNPVKSQAPSVLEVLPSTETGGTACLSCARDHFCTASAALSEGVRFAREHEVRHPEVTRRLRIALEELNILERIDLAPSEVVSLTAREKEPAEWALANSRGLRHAITDIQDVKSMEQAAAQASEITEEFMQRYWKLAQECPQCKSVKEKAKQFAERLRQEGAQR